jgi:putative mycofactocin binding protein MftB
VRLVAFDLRRAYRLNPAATLRPEPFGALAYHFGNRRLSFLKSRQLVSVVRLLESHDSAADALDAAGVPAQQWSSYAAALSALASSEVIDER